MKIFLKQNSGALKRFKVPYSDLSQSSRFRDMSGEVSTVAVPSSGPVIGLSERTDALVRGLVFLLEHHRAPSRITCQLKEQLHDYLDTSRDEGIWLKRAKYVLTYPFAKFLRNELPPSPDAVFRPSGALRRWMKARMNAFCRRNVHLWYSWLQVKRCALSVSDFLIADSYEKHFKQLTMPDPCLDEESPGSQLLDEIFENPTFRTVLAQVRDGVSATYVNHFTEHSPSTSASFEASRKMGGQAGGLKDYLAELKPFFANGVDAEGHLEDTSVRCENDRNQIEELKNDYPQSTDKLLPYEHRSATRLQWIGGDELVRMTLLRVVRGDHVEETVVERRELYGRYWWNMLMKIRDSRLTIVPANLDATIQAVLEPLKIRIISKGPSYEYYEMKPLQKAIHGVMRTMPCFRLIGRPLCPTDLIDCLPEVIGDKEWHSVDYSAATDGLSSEFGMRILEFILRDVPMEDRLRAGKVLGPHRLHYPEFKNGKWTARGAYRGCQTNGQLMGGILSFPILCLANLGVYLKVLEESRGQTTKDDLRRVLVNGDDMLYIGDQKEWDLHKEIGKAVGLEMSVGKAYRHRSYANANSTCFVFDLNRQQLIGENLDSMRLDVVRHPFQINFLNVGLVFGQHKVQAREAGTAESHHMTSGCVPNIPAILDGCLPGRQSEVLRYILLKRRNEIREDTYCEVRQGKKSRRASRNLFLPISMGGMGVSPPLDWRYRVKKIDRRIAASMQGLVPTSCLPLPGYPAEKDMEVPPPWVAKSAEPSSVEFVLGQGRLRVVPLVPEHPYWYHRGAIQR